MANEVNITVTILRSVPKYSRLNRRNGTKVEKQRRGDTMWISDDTTRAELVAFILKVHGLHQRFEAGQLRGPSMSLKFYRS
jgi:hypothetical protein